MIQGRELVGILAKLTDPQSPNDMTEEEVETLFLPWLRSMKSAPPQHAGDLFIYLLPTLLGKRIVSTKGQVLCGRFWILSVPSDTDFQ